MVGLIFTWQFSPPKTPPTQKPPLHRPHLTITFHLAHFVSQTSANRSPTSAADSGGRASEATMESSPQPQYQHYVPKFLLRNFAHPYKPSDRKKRKGGRKDENGVYYGEAVVRSVDLTSNPPVICEKPINRILGQMDMYDDKTKSGKEQRRIEEVLGRLENQAALAFTKIKKAYAEHQERQGEEGEREQPEHMGAACLTRSERDCIRKFLYILKYRGLMDHQRYNHQMPGAYVAEDREYMHEFMDEKLYERPLNVWLDNIKQIIDMDMDLEYDWAHELTKRMYPEDAMMFFMHSEMFYMCICTPANPDDEFLLTDNSYNVFEGPNTFIRNKQTGKVQQSLFAPLHMFAPVSPKLMIVLRNALLPNPLEDADEEIRREREMERRIDLGAFSEDLRKSLLADLPVAKARNNYSKVIDGRLTVIPGWDGKKKKEDRFYFDFFPIDRRHVNTINSVFLGNLGPSTSVIFETTATFARTLDWFLTSPSSFGKIMSGMEGDGHEESLRKLEVISRSLGSTGETVSTMLDIQEKSHAIHETFLEKYKAKRWMLKKLVIEEDEKIKGFFDQMDKPDNKFMRSYLVLGSLPPHFP